MTQSAFSNADLNAFVDGQTDPRRAAALARAIAADPAARARVEAWKRQNEALRLMFAPVVFETVPLRLLPHHLRRSEAEADSAPPPRHAEPVAAAPAPAVPSRKGFGPGPAAVVLGLTVAAGWAAGFAGVGGDMVRSLAPARTGPTAAPDLGPMTRRAGEAHLTFAAEPDRGGELGTNDMHRLGRQLEARLGLPLRLPDLKPQGWTLVSAHVVPADTGPAAFLLYASGADRLGLYAGRAPVEGPAGAVLTEPEAPGRGSVLAWSEDITAYALTSDHPPGWWAGSGAPIVAASKVPITRVQAAP